MKVRVTRTDLGLNVVDDLREGVLVARSEERRAPSPEESAEAVDVHERVRHVPAFPFDEGALIPRP